MSFSDHCLSFCLSVCQLFIFSSSSPDPQSQFQPNLAQSILELRGFKFVQMKVRPFPRGDNYKRVLIHWRIIKIFFSRSTEPISTKLGTNHHWVTEIQVFLKKGPRPYNYEKAIIHWRNSNIFFSRTTGPISTKHGTMHPWVKGI